MREYQLVMQVTDVCCLFLTGASCSKQAMTSQHFIHEAPNSPQVLSNAIDGLQGGAPTQHAPDHLWSCKSQGAPNVAWPAACWACTGVRLGGVGMVPLWLVSQHAHTYTVMHADELVETLLHLWRLQALAIQMAYWLTLVDTAAAQINDSHSRESQAIFCHHHHDIVMLEIPHAPTTCMHAGKCLRRARISHACTHR